MEKVHTPDLPGIDGVAAELGVPPGELLKSIAFDVDGEVGLALVPGDREINPYLLQKAVAPRTARLFDDDDFEQHPELPKGYIGPHLPGVVTGRRRPLRAFGRLVGHRRERPRLPRPSRRARP